MESREFKDEERKKGTMSKLLTFLLREGKTDVDGPMELEYMRNIRWRLTPIDSWPSKLLKDTAKRSPFLIPHKFLFCMWLLVLGLQLYYVKINQGVLSFIMLGNTYITIMLTVVTWHRTTFTMNKKYLECVRIFVQEMHMFYHKTADKYALKIYKRVNFYCTIVSSVLFFQMWLGIIFFNLTPLATNYFTGMFNFNGDRPANGTFSQAVYFWAPFDYITWFPGFLIYFTTNAVFSFWVCTSCSMLDNFVLIIAFHLWGHLKVLDYRLYHFPMPTVNSMIFYSEEERPAVVDRLKDLMIYHRKIISFANHIDASFGPALAIYFTFHQICCCILLLEVSQMDIKSFGQHGSLTIFAFGEMILFSVVFEILGTMSEGISDAVYHLPWECMAIPQRRLVFVFLITAQRPITLKALGLIPIGVKTMASIIKTSISYFVMLRALDN